MLRDVRPALFLFNGHALRSADVMLNRWNWRWRWAERWGDGRWGEGDDGA